MRFRCILCWIFTVSEPLTDYCATIMAIVWQSRAYFLLVSLAKLTNSVLQVEVVTLGSVNLLALPLSLSLINTGPAIDTAVKELREEYGNVFNLTHTYIYDKRGVTCIDTFANSDYMLAEWYYNKRIAADVYAFISPTCIEFENVNRLAAGWNILMLTSAATGTSEFRNKTISPTRVTTGATSITSYVKILENVLNVFEWRSLYMVVDVAAIGAVPVFATEAAKVIKSLPDTQLTLVRINRTNPQLDYSKIMQEFRQISRVFLFVGYGATFHRFMVNASQLNMVNGEFVYIFIEFLKGLDEPFTWKYHDSYDSTAREAYRSVLFIAPDDSIYDLPPENMCEKWANETWRVYNVSNKRSEMVLNQTITLKPAFDYRDGKEFARLFFNRTYNLNYTDMFIDGAGERITKLVIKDMDQKTGNFEPVGFQDPIASALKFSGVIDWGGSDPRNTVPLNTPLCGYRGDQGPCAYKGYVARTYGVTFGVTFSCVLIILACAFYWIRKWSELQNNRWWNLDIKHLTFTLDDDAAGSWGGLPMIRQRDAILPHQGRKVLYLNEDVWVDSFPAANSIAILETLFAKKVSERLTVIFRELRRHRQANINPFRGICFSITLNRVHFLTEYCQRGSLHDLLERSISIDSDQCPLLVIDFLEGMRYIHRSVFGHHGNITGWKCLIDRHFSLQLSQLGFRSLNLELLSNKTFGNANVPDKLYWTAPEILRGKREPDKSTDIYAVGVVLYEIMTSCPPFQNMSALTSPLSIVNEIRFGGKKPLRPDIDVGGERIPKALYNIICQCWDEEPELRPDIQEVYEIFCSQFNIVDHKPLNLMEKLLKRLDDYGTTLEKEVLRKTLEILAEKKNCDMLLKEMLPESVIRKLRNGEIVEPEMFESVTLMFGDVYGFAEYTSSRTPFEVTNLLNKLYSIFDPVLGYYNVYKVETIGNVYMVASGVPVRNGMNHVKEICSLALALRTVFCVTTTLTEGMSFRAGIHTGSCAAGVMGRTNPRYCLFGDTVNTASRMGTHSLPNKIHLSTASAKVIKQFTGFLLTERGVTEIKGKGMQKTFWLDNS